MQEDLYVELEYCVSTSTPIIVDTNVKREQINNVLEWWLNGQIGRGEDKRKAKEQDIYHIRISADLTDDTFSSRSDTGNKGLTAGILMHSLGKWKFSPELEQRIKDAEQAAQPTPSQ